MNCRPNQLAWIVVPPRYQGTGLEQIDRHVVMTMRLLGGFAEATWLIDPPQRVTFRALLKDAARCTLFPGEVGETHELPDSRLRPFDPLSEPRQTPDLIELPILEQTL